MDALLSGSTAFWGVVGETACKAVDDDDDDEGDGEDDGSSADCSICLDLIHPITTLRGPMRNPSSFRSDSSR